MGNALPWLLIAGAAYLYLTGPGAGLLAARKNAIVVSQTRGLLGGGTSVTIPGLGSFSSGPGGSSFTLPNLFGLLGKGAGTAAQPPVTSGGFPAPTPDPTLGGGQNPTDTLVANPGDPNYNPLGADTASQPGYTVPPDLQPDSGEGLTPITPSGGGNDGSCDPSDPLCGSLIPYVTPPADWVSADPTVTGLDGGSGSTDPFAGSVDLASF